MNLRMTIETWEKGSWYIAKCPELDFVSQGKTPEEAKRNLLKVAEIQEDSGSGDLTVVAEDIYSGNKYHETVDLVVLATRASRESR